VPKSVNEARQRSNLDIWDFKLSQEEMDQLDALDRSTADQNTMAGWLREHDPDFY
jgi:diketogulonate reductase-like aldo/keto reductase